MILPGQIEKIIQLHNIGKETARSYTKKRFLYHKIKDMLNNKLLIGIAGLRGVGKTVLLRQLALELENSIYISLDALDQAVDLFELIRELSKNYGIKYVLLDEIHNHVNWQQELKKVFDFLEAKIIFTASASIDIIRSKHDLSRRAIILHMKTFSFREYVYFKKDILLEKLEFESIIEDPAKYYQKLFTYEGDFNDFCKGGALPCLLGAPYPQTIKNIIEKIANSDLLAIEKIGIEDIQNINNILRFISRSGVDINYSAIAKNTGITKYKARIYINLLESTFILKVILPYGSNVTKEPKILYALPFRPYFAEGVEIDKLTGALREEFFVQHISDLGELNYLKSKRGERLPDYMVFYKNKKFVFEIGGVNKSKSQIKGMTNEECFIVTEPWNSKSGGIPLILFGFLE